MCNGDARGESSALWRNPILMLMVAAAAFMLAGFGSAKAAEAATNVLVFTGGATNGSVSAATAAIEDFDSVADFDVTVSSNAADFTSEGLADYRAVVLLHNTGNPFNEAQQSALAEYVAGGGGLLTVGEGIGIHPGVTAFNDLFGIATGNRISAVAGTPARTIEAGDRVHPATRDMPVTQSRTGQWYSYTANPSGTSHVVARVRTGNQALSDDGVRGGSNTQPIAWCRDQQNGRTFYTGLGGSTADWSNAQILAHIQGALEWTSGSARANCKATINSNYTSTRLSNRGTGLQYSGESHGLSIADNGMIVFIGRADCVTNEERGARVAPPVASSPRVTDWSNPNVGVGCGSVHVFDPSEYTGTQNSGVTRAGTLAVFGDMGTSDEAASGGNYKPENGLLGVTVAPDFETTGHVYLMYYPTLNPASVPAGLSDGAQRRISKMGKGRISRFTLNLETKQLDMNSEVKIFEYETQIFSCCHVGGGLGFDSAGNLYITTGDSNSSGGEYSGNWQNVRCPTGTPTEATGAHCGANNVSYRDARRTAGNTNDYNGKMLRIKPIPTATPATPIGIGSTYSIPTAADPNGANLFSGTEGNGNQAKPEIYAMGLRNPSRLNIDPATDIPYSAWVGPDAGAANTSLGPAKYETAARLRTAGNYGWPYCMGGSVNGQMQAYRDRIADGSERTTNTGGYLNGGAGSAGWYDCDNIVNDSTNNTGLSGALPHSTGTGKDAGKGIAPQLWYAPGGGGGGCADYTRTASGVPNYSGATSLCPYVQGGGQAIMAGPVYRYDEGANDNSMRWPEYWDGRWFLGDESGGDNVRHGLLIEDGTAGDAKPPAYADNMKSIITWSNGAWMDAKFGPDGAFYLQTYDGFFRAGGNVGLTRIAYTGGPDTPTATITAIPTGEPGEYRFSSGGSGGIEWAWDFGDDGTSAEENPVHTYTEDGQYEVTLTVSYADGEETERTIQLNVFADDTTAPTTTATLDPAEPGPGGTYEQGPVAVTLTADDGPEGSGVDYTEYRLSASGAWAEYAGPVNVAGNGDKIVQFRSVDLAGNTEAIKSVEFTIGSGTPGGGCTAQSDGFDGTTLNPKWNVLRPNATNPVTLGDGFITLPFLRNDGDGDFFAERGAAANSLLQTAPGSGSWVATAKLEHTGIDSDGKAIGVVVVNNLNPNYFVKSAVQYKNDINGIWAERVLTVNNQSVLVGDETVPYPNSGPLNPTSDFVWVRIVYNEDTEEFSTWTSTDGENFTTYGNNVDATLFTQNGGAVQVGMFAKHDGSGMAGEGRVDAFNVVTGTADPQTPGDDCGTPGACTMESDEFDGSSLDGKWEIINPDTTNPHTVADGHLTLPILPGDVYADRPIATNTIVQPMPAGDWVATAKVAHAAIDADGKAAGLALINNISPNYVAKSALQYKADTDPNQGGDQPGKWAERVMTVNNQTQVLGDDGVPWPNSGALNPPGDYVWVRIIHDSTTNEFTTWTSVDGETFTSYGANMPAELFDQNQGLMKIGVFAKHDGTGMSGAVDIDSFNVVTGTTDPQTPGDDCGGSGGTVPVTTASIEPGAPNGANGWYRTAVAVSLDAESEVEIDRTEYRLNDDEEWTVYDGPVQVVDTGEYVLQYRSVDIDGGEESPRSISFKVDTSDPVTTATYDPGQSVPEGPVSIALDASDEGAGLASTEYRIDNGEWTPYEPASEVIYDGTQASLDRWLMAGPGSFTQQDGFMRTQGGLGMLWFPAEYGNFKVKMQWRDSSPDGVGNSGVFVRFPDPRIPLAERPETGPGAWTGTYCGRQGSAASQPAWVAIMCGQEIQINDHQPGEVQKTGSVYNFEPLNAEQAMVQPKGTWVDYEVQVVGQQYTITRNGEVINEFDNSIPKESSRGGDPPTDARQFDAGFIGLQNHGGSDIVDFRDVEVVRLDDEGNEVAGPVVDGQGRHTVEYRSTDLAGNTEQPNSDEVLIGVSQRTTLQVTASPKSKSLKSGKSFKAKIRIRNTGDITATRVKVCVKSPAKNKAAVQGKKSICRTKANLGVGAGAQWVPSFKIKKGAKGKTVRLKVVVTAGNAAKKTTTIRLKLKR